MYLFASGTLLEGGPIFSTSAARIFFLLTVHVRYIQYSIPQLYITIFMRKSLLISISHNTNVGHMTGLSIPPSHVIHYTPEMAEVGLFPGVIGT